MARSRRTATHVTHICGLYYILPDQPKLERHYLPQLSLSVNAKIVSSTSRTTLTQTFVNPKSVPIPELRYTFPLYDGVSVVGFVCTINDDRVIHGVVKERAEARQTYKAAIDRGESAGLLEQLPEASDVFTTTFGSIPANATLKVEITYLGELKHDAEVDGIRFTIPTSIAPRYGSYPGQLLESSTASANTGISIVVDVEMPDGSNIKNVQSPSHPISVTLGNTSVGAASGADMSLQKASATLALSTSELGDDFVLQVVATNTGRPIAVLETHPTLPNHRALMATLVPKFNLPASKPEIVFLCDRSGSMDGPHTIPNLKKALHVFLKSLPVGVKFNIVSFGSRHVFLFKESRTYDQASLEEATRYVDSFAADMGGTNILAPMADVFKYRHADMDLEVFLLTDGDIWAQEQLFEYVNKHVVESKGRIRVFSLGIGSNVSHALIEGVAAAGNGFSQTVGDKENMNSKVVRMLKASLTPHIKDYTLEIKYGKEDAATTAETDADDDFEMVEKVMDALVIDVQQPGQADAPQQPISLFDESANPDVEMVDASLDTTAGGKYSHVPPVSEPKLLQAPFVIPPLFPFSRTSVYLLMSPETAQKQPKSVVLRGTSAYGPVELEIPVTVLADKGETIHQLAARKAVKELEDGRGWIYHAKDTTDASTPLLKDKYPGRFRDMVEREAVRLGVTYQVGGKWCSFVAVEANRPEKEEEPVRSPTDTGSNAIESPAPSRCAFGSPSTFTMAQSSPPAPCPTRRGFAAKVASPRKAAASAMFTPSQPAFESLQSCQESHSAPPPLGYSPSSPPPPAVPLDGGDVLFRRSANTMGQFSAIPPLVSGAPMAAFSATPPLKRSAPGYGPYGMGSRLRHRKILPSQNSDEEDVDDDDDDQDQASSDGADGDDAEGGAEQQLSAEERERMRPVDAADVARMSDEEKLGKLVAWQGFSGSWEWDERLVLLVGLKKDMEVPVELGVGAAGSEVLATAMVLGFLKKELGGLRDEWEMLADKARGWLEGEVSGRSVEEYLEAVKGFMQREAVKV